MRWNEGDSFVETMLWREECRRQHWAIGDETDGETPGGDA